MIQTVHSDCLDHMRSMAAGSVDAIVSDPPYGLSFMGKDWDHGVPGKHFWEEALRVAKPGAHLLAFGGTRTFHRLAVAIEDAGWEIRDMIAWVYGQGFPKSLNVDKHFCTCGRPVPESHYISGHGAKAKSEHELRPVQEAHISQAVYDDDKCGKVLQPLVQKQGAPTAGRTQPPYDVREGQPGVEGRRDNVQEEGQLREREVCESAEVGAADGAKGRICDGASLGNGDSLRQDPHEAGGGASPGSQPREQQPEEPGVVAMQRNAQAGRVEQGCEQCGKPVPPFDVYGWGTALKPAWEPIIMARKPLAGTVVQNVLEHGTGAINVDGCRVELETDCRLLKGGTYGGNRGSDKGTSMFGTNTKGLEYEVPSANGRWPANLIHDGSEEVLAGFPQTGPSKSGGKAGVIGYHAGGSGADRGGHDDNGGSAARFFKTCEHDEFPLLLCDAKAIFGAWKTSPANTAESPSHQPSPSADFVRDLVLFAEHCGATLQSRRWTEHFTNATPIELSDLCTLVTMAILFTEARSWRVSQPAKHTLPNSRVSIAETNEQTGITTITIDRSTSDGFAEVATFGIMPLNAVRGEAASASRLVYCAKASKSDRGESNGHPTVKPTELMRYLCRLVTPPNGVVFDPFMGSGSTGKAAVLEGFSFIGCDLQEEYVKIASARIEHAERQRIRDEGLFAA